MGNSKIFKIIEKTGSVKFFFWLSIIISLHFYIAVIALKAGIDPKFKTLNNYVLIDWIKNYGADHICITTWIFIAFVFVSILFVNMFARVIVELNNLLNLYSKSNKVFFIKKASVFVIHFSVVLFVVIHFTSSVSGYKSPGAVIKEGGFVSHPKYSNKLKCIELKKTADASAGPRSAPKIVLKDELTNHAFAVPGWNNGFYYRVYADFVPKIIKNSKTGKERTVKTIGLKLIVSELNVLIPLLFASFLCLTGLFTHILMKNRIIAGEK
jgi:hypothetical protein